MIFPQLNNSPRFLELKLLETEGRRQKDTKVTYTQQKKVEFLQKFSFESFQELESPCEYCKIYSK